MAVAIRNGRILTASGKMARGTVVIREDRIAEILPQDAPPPRVDVEWLADGLLVLPGIIDLHGDAFERQIMPRSGVHFPVDAALLETDRQLVANGITTAYHGVTWSWEPGLRGREAAVEVVDAIAGLRGRLACDTRVHLRHETFNLEAVETLLDWLETGRIHLLAFNDHLDGIARDLDRPAKAAEYAERSGLSVDAFRARLTAVAARRAEVPDSLARLAGQAWRRGVPVATHDDDQPGARRRMHLLGSRLCEFPVDAVTARAARDLGDAVIMGAPNVLRGGSHCGRMGAQDAIGDGLCTVLASDYYYPSLVQAVFRLAEEGVAVLSDAWALVSANPAEAVGLNDRGAVAPGLRADLVLVDDRDRRLPRVVATFVAGRCVHSAVDPRRHCRTGGLATAQAAE